MEIRIDTSRDSKEDIRKAIEFLKTLVDSPSGQGQPQGPDPGVTLGMELFGDERPKDGDDGAKPKKESSIFDDDSIQIIPY